MVLGSMVHGKSRPAPWGLEKLFSPVASTQRPRGAAGLAFLQLWDCCSDFSQLLGWQVASASERSRHRFPTTARALRIRSLAAMRDLMLILEESWCLSRQNCSILQLPSGLHSKLHSACPQLHLADGSRQLGKSGFDIRQ